MKISLIEHIELVAPVDVYDIEVPENDNFRLEAGVFVHNSKDISDAVCGLCWLLERTQLTSSSTQVEVVSQVPEHLKRVQLGKGTNGFKSARNDYFKQKRF